MKAAVLSLLAVLSASYALFLAFILVDQLMATSPYFYLTKAGIIELVISPTIAFFSIRSLYRISHSRKLLPMKKCDGFEI